MPRLNRPPKLGLHKASGQACVHWQGKRHYLGVYGSKQAAEGYARFLTAINELAEGEEAVPTPPKVGWITCIELGAAYLQFAEGWYLKDGKPTTQLGHVKQHIRILVDHVGSLAVNEFGPRRLKALQEVLVRQGLSRVGVNARIGGIKRIFRWGESEEIVPRGTAQSLGTVRGLSKGRTKARELPPVLPVDDGTVEATLPFLSAVVADMVKFQRLTGCRPGEVCGIRPMDVDRSTDVWVYRPEHHKTEHHDRDRLIFIGPKAQDVLRPYLLRPAESFCFSPAEAEKQRLDERHAERVTPEGYGNAPGTNRLKHPTRSPGHRYFKDAYNRAITRAITKANQARRAAGQEPIEAWSPNRLRHAAATEVRRQFGLEGAQVVLGHSKADVTQVYAERDAELAKRVALRLG